MLDCIASKSPIDAAAQKRLIEHATRLAEAGNDLRSADVRPLVSAMLVRAQVHPDRIELTLSRDRLAHWLQARHKDKARRLATTPDSDARPITVSIPAGLKRAGKEMRIIVEDGSDPVIPDASLVRAHAIRERLINDRSLVREYKTSWRRKQSAANRSPRRNSLLTGKNTGKLLNFGSLVRP